jgi:hypothetical protein
MARVTWWIGSALLVCAAVAFAYLPPRAEPVFARRYREEPVPPYRYRVQELADAWRSTALELRLRQYRERLRPELERRKALDLAGPALLMDWPNASDSLRGVVAGKIEAEWRYLGLGVSKVSVGVVLAQDRMAADPDEPSLQGNLTAYLLPDSTDRTTCVVLQTSTSVRWLRGGVNLGPCAFYAAFGAPGREIGGWLGARDFELAISPLWERRRASDESEWLLARGKPWFWWQVYRYEANGVACLAGRAERCRLAVIDPRHPGGELPHLVTLFQRGPLRPPALAGGTHYLADVVRSVGRERFQHFWNSELPVDTALAEALRLPVGEWTRRWQAGLVPPIQLGAAPSAGSAILGVLLALAALGIVLRTAARREVR